MMTHDDMMIKIMAVVDTMGEYPSQTQMDYVNSIIDQYHDEQMEIAGTRNHTSVWDADRQEYRCTANGHIWWHPMWWIY